MARFITDKAVAYFNYINRHLLEDFMGTTVTIYKAKPQSTSDNIYGESLGKSFFEGVVIEAFIEHDDQTANVQEYGSDYQQSIRVLFNRDMLKEINLDPEEGDILQWNSAFYEIGQRVENQLVGGDPVYSFSHIYQANLTSLSRINIDRHNIRD